MKNKLSDLNNHLFAQLERLGDEDLTPEQLEAEARRADAMVGVSDMIVRNAALQLRAVETLAAHGDRYAPQLAILTGGEQHSHSHQPRALSDRSAAATGAANPTLESPRSAGQ